MWFFLATGIYADVGPAFVKGKSLSKLIRAWLLARIAVRRCRVGNADSPPDPPVVLWIRSETDSVVAAQSQSNQTQPTRARGMLPGSCGEGNRNTRLASLRCAWKPWYHRSRTACPVDAPSLWRPRSRADASRPTRRACTVGTLAAVQRYGGREGPNPLAPSHGGGCFAKRALL